MVGSVWRFAHLCLAIVSFLFLIIASVTGVILAIDAVNEKVPAYKSEHFQELTLNQILPNLREKYPEIIELAVDHNQFVTIEGFDHEGNDFKFIANPETGEKIADPIVKSDFIQWVTSLHRSLFLHETGRFIVGIFSFLLILITVSGIALVVKNQLNFKRFYSKINKEYFSQYYHIALGRIMLFPILVISLTGTYLFLIRFDVIQKAEFVQNDIQNIAGDALTLNGFPVFKEVYLADVTKIEFPFADDPEEFFKIKLKDKELLVNQINGKVVAETFYPTTTIFENLSLDLHTGRTNSVWAIVLAIASLNILFFIYSGFVIFLKRKQVKITNKIKANDAEIVILVGSEKGNALFFAHKIFKQLLVHNQKVHLTNLNDYKIFDSVKQFIIFTSTYGLGEAPANANLFEELLAKYPQNHLVNYSVVGFGSKNYKDFCAFAFKVHDLLEKQAWAKSLHRVFTVNDKSLNDFVLWTKKWSKVNDISLSETPAVYQQKKPKLSAFKVIDISKVSNNNQTFQITLQPNKKVAFQSGDLLEIYPTNNHIVRHYSIAKVNNQVQLLVKLHDKGLGSQFLYNQNIQSVLQAAVIKNEHFHFPKKSTKVLMIANGTGIAPFLGMINENKPNCAVHLYVGFRHENDKTKEYRKFLKAAIQNKKLAQFKFSFSREAAGEYVMDNITRDAVLFADTLKNNGVIMICGSLNMQKDVEQVLNKICLEINNQPLSYYKNNGQLKTDCY